MKRNRSNFKKKNLVVVITTIILLTLIGLYFIQNNFMNSTQFNQLEEVTVRLKWLHQSQFAGHYIADKKGYYEESGLKVNLQSFDYISFPIEDVTSGKAQFGVTGAEELLIARSKGAKIKALAVIYQNSPVVAYSLASSGIKKPEDMIGKKVGIEKGINVEMTIRAMIERQGIAYKDIETVMIGFDIDPLINGEIDVATGYETNEPIQAETAGYEVNIIAPYKYGIKMYGDVLFTSEKMIEEKPELVRAFVKETLRGWEYALENQDEAVDITLMYKDPNNKVLNHQHQSSLLAKSQNLIKPTMGLKIGEMNYLSWKKTYDLLRNAQLINIDMDVTNAFTKEFLE